MLGFSAVGEAPVSVALPRPYSFSEPFDSGSSPWSFDTFNGTAGVLNLDTSNQLHGGGCLSVGTTLNAGRLRINAANLPLSGKLFIRFYLKVTAVPSGTSILFKHSGPSGANLMQIGYGTGLGLALRDSAGAFSASHTLTSGSWYRVEALHDMDASKIQMRVWNSPESTGAADFDSGLVASAGTPDLLTLGQDSSVTSAHLIDEFKVSTSDWIGPVVAAGTTATPTEATATGTANNATVSASTLSAEASGTGTANDATVDSTSFITGGNTGNSTGPSVTFPSTIQSGQVITLMLMLNNTDNITASPSELTTLDSMGMSGSGQGTSYLYRMVADGTTASSTLSWTLAATRNWSIAYVAYNDVDQDPTNPFVGFNSASDTVTATSSFTAPSATSTGVGYALEFMGVKANGTAIGLFTEPSGWTKRQQVLNSNTFGSNIAIGTRNGNPVAAGTYGSDVWTTDVTATTSFRYTIVLPQTPGTAASTGDAIAYDAAPSVVVNAAEATATGAAAWDAGDTVDAVLIGDNPIFVTGTAYDATVSTAVITNAPAAEATATGTANDAGTLVSPLSTGATGSGAANDAGNGVAAIASEATATGAAADAGNAVQFTATEATSAGAAGDTSSAVLVTPMEATATGTAYDATVSASANGAATPTEAAAAGAAFDAIIAVSFTPTEAAALATAANALGRVAATVGAAIVAGDAGNIAAGGPPTGGSHGGAGSPRASSGTGPDRPTGGDTAARPHGGHGPARATSSTPPSRARGG